MLGRIVMGGRLIPFLLLCIYATKAEEVSCLPQELLQSAVQYTCSATFRSNRSMSMDRVLTHVSVMGKDGKMRFESYSQESQRNYVWVMPYPNDTHFHLRWVEEKDNQPIGRHVVQCLYCSPRDYFSFLRLQLKPEILQRVKFSVTLDSNRYILTVRHPCAETDIANTPGMNFADYPGKLSRLNEDFFWNELGSGTFRQAPEIFRDAYFETIVFEIDATPGQPFIYGYKAYNEKGVLRHSERLLEVVFSPSLSDDLFSPPPKSLIEQVETEGQYSDLHFKYYPPKEPVVSSPQPRPGWFQQWWFRVKYDPMRFLISCLYWVAIVVAVASLVTSIVLKIREWRQR